MLWGVVSETGVKVGGTGYSVSHTGPGRWLLHFDTAFAAQPRWSRAGCTGMRR